MSELDFYAYETYCMVRIEEREDDRRLLAGCREIALKVEQALNMYEEKSELSTLCRDYRVNEPYEVSELLYRFLEINLKMAEICEGAFDPTIGALVKRWGIGSGNDDVLMESEVLETMERTGYLHVRLVREQHAVVIDKDGIIIDPGASGKGLAIDDIVKYLKENGVCRACIDFGGNLYVMGGVGDERCEEVPVSFGDRLEETGLWRIGIRHPDTPEKIIAAARVRDKAVSTSSWYEHHFEKDGRIYGHLLDPGTGEPVEAGLVSVTVICDYAVYADILSTALYVLGESRGMRVIHRLRDELGMAVDYALMRSDRSLMAEGHCFSSPPCLP